MNLMRDLYTKLHAIDLQGALNLAIISHESARDSYYPESNGVLFAQMSVERIMVYMVLDALGPREPAVYAEPPPPPPPPVRTWMDAWIDRAYESGQYTSHSDMAADLELAEEAVKRAPWMGAWLEAQTF